MTNEQLLILKTEITNDPKVLGYAGKTDQKIMDLLNEPGKSGETILKERIVAEDIINAIDPEELDGFTDRQSGQLQFVINICGKDGLNISKVKDKVLSILAVLFKDKKIVDNLPNELYRSAARAEMLLGVNKKVNNFTEIRKARSMEVV